MPTLLWAILLAAALPSNATYTVDPAASVVRYTVIHKLHEVHGVSHAVEAKAVVKEDGQVLAMVRIPVASFRSGDANRDEHMLEAVNAGRFPFVVVKGIARLGPGRELPPGATPTQAQVELRGVETAQTIPVELALQPDGSVRAHGSFDVSLDAHHVERPSLLFVRIEDRCHLEFDLAMRARP